jgi:outer membrane receptor protein involved in Fe transport
VSAGASIVAAAILATAAPTANLGGSAVTSYAPTYFVAASPTTALDMVQLLPGFTFDNGNSVRGFGGAAGNVLINADRPASKDDSLYDALKRIPASSVLRIDVIRGGAPGIDMQGKAIIANVVLRSDGGAKLLVAASVVRAYDGRLAPAGRAEGSMRIGQTTLEGSILLAKGFDDGAGDGLRTRTGADGTLILTGHEVNKGIGVNEKLTGAVESPIAGGKLRVSASLSSSPYDLTTADTLQTPPGTEFEHYWQGQKTAEVGVRYTRPLGLKLTSETYLLQQLGRGSVNDDFSADPSVAAITGDDTSDIYALRKTTGESIVRSKLRFEDSRKLSLEAGVEGDYNWLTARTTFLENGAPVVLPAANVHVTETRGEAFGTAIWTATPKLTLEGGLRIEASTIGSTGDVVSSQSFVYPKPRVALTWSPDTADQVRFRVEREVGQLNFDDFVGSSGNLSTGEVHAGNPRLDPQTDWVFEGSYERRFWSGGDATVTLRHYALRDVIDRVPVDSSSGEFDAAGNIGSGRQEEAAFSLTLPTDRIGLARGLLTGTTTFRYSRVIDPTTLQPRPISQLHPNDWEAHFTQGLPKLKSTWGFDAFGQWQGTSYRFDEIDTDKLKTYVGLFGEYKPKSDLIFRFELRNASGRGFEHSREVYNGPRDQTGLAFVDVRDLHTGRFLYFRVTKTFG